MGKPSVYPTGATYYRSKEAWNGYTVFPSFYGATAVDMDGRIVKVWKGVSGNPMKPLPGGRLLASMGNVAGAPGANSSKKAVLAGFDGQILWQYDHNVQVKDPKTGETEWVSRHHHDYELEAWPVYAAPEADRSYGKDRVLLLTHNPLYDLKVSEKEILDERIIEVDLDGNLLWDWKAHEHIDEMGLGAAARKALFANPMMGGDWIHLNAVSTLGPNRLYDAGDQRFRPENILCSSRQLDIIFIIEKASGKIIWRVGPDYSVTPGLGKIGQIIGQHHAHMIPKGLPGEGNILVFDNGSFGGFGEPAGNAPDGTNNMRRHYSRVVEFDPVTLDLVWEYTKADRNAEDVNEMNAQNFFSPFVSSCQRLANGNTLINQGADGIFQEVTPDKRIVWEFVNPIRHPYMPEKMQFTVYRAYRIPYEWLPIEKPEEIDITPPAIEDYHVPGAFPPGDPESFTTIIH